MAASTPLTRLALSASSVADDIGYVALSDLAQALADIPESYRVIGGHQVAGNRFARVLSGALAIRDLFSKRRSTPMATLGRQHQLSGRAADERHTRIRALITRVLGP